jgi:histidinol-phosphate aminotransferase
VLQAFGGPGRTALGFTPSYAMYPLISKTTGTAWVDGLRGVAGFEGSSSEFDLDLDRTVDQIRRLKPAITFLCSPNNPTGTALNLDVVAAAYEATDGIVVVDEAYVEFARPGTPSALTLLPGRERLIVSRTMSKAFALAGARVGYLAAHPAVSDALRLVRLPYHLSSLTQAAALAALRHADDTLGSVAHLVAERRRVAKALTDNGFDVVDSDANFLLFGTFDDQAAVWRDYLDSGVLLRDMGIDGYLRATIGTDAENDVLLDVSMKLQRMRENQ